MSEKFKESINSATPTLVDFYATWCGPCQRMHPVLDELKGKIGDKATILKVDVDQNQSLAAEFNVQSVPTLIIFKNGKAMWREVGLQRVTTLEAAIEQIANS